MELFRLGLVIRFYVNPDPARLDRSLGDLPSKSHEEDPVEVEGLELCPQLKTLGDGFDDLDATMAWVGLEAGA